MKELQTFPKLDLAIRRASQWHAGQDRSGDAPLPYIVHPIEVILNLRYVGGVKDEDLLVVAALHDVLEETDAKAEAIEEEFGKGVADLVQELTRYEPTKKERKGLTGEQIWALRSGLLLEEISRMSVRAQQIKLADRLSNLRESYRTREGVKLGRYVDQSGKILEIVPREVNAGLWDAIRAEMTIPR